MNDLQQNMHPVKSFAEKKKKVPTLNATGVCLVRVTMKICNFPFAENETANESRWARLLSVHSVSSSSRESPELTQTLTWEKTVQRLAHSSSTAHWWIKLRRSAPPVVRRYFSGMIFMSAYVCASPTEFCQWQKRCSALVWYILLKSKNRRR